MSLAVVSGGERAYILGDVFHGPAQVTETGWQFSFDMDAAQGAATRAAMIDRAGSENAVYRHLSPCGIWPGDPRRGPPLLAIGLAVFPHPNPPPKGEG